MPDPQHPQVLSLQEAAARLHVDVRTIRRYIQRGRLKGYRLGPKLMRVDAAAIDQLLKPVPTVAARPAVPAPPKAGGFAISPALLDRLVAQAVADAGSWHRPLSRAADYLWPADQALTIEPKRL